MKNTIVGLLSYLFSITAVIVELKSAKDLKFCFVGIMGMIFFGLMIWLLESVEDK